MDAHSYAQGFSKGLELWSLQNILNLGMIFLFFATGLITFKGYLQSYKDHMTLRLGSELWETVIEVLSDGLLLLVFLIGFVTTNPDIMIDIKIALPWFPLASLFAGFALAVRVLYGGKKLYSRSWKLVVILLLISSLLYWFGFTFVMEGATDEYYVGKTFPYLWSILHNMRSDMNQELAIMTFYWLAPIYALVFFSSLLVPLFRPVSKSK